MNACFPKKNIQYDLKKENQLWTHPSAGSGFSSFGLCFGHTSFGICFGSSSSPPPPAEHLRFPSLLRTPSSSASPPLRKIYLFRSHHNSTANHSQPQDISTATARPFQNNLFLKPFFLLLLFSFIRKKYHLFHPHLNPSAQIPIRKNLLFVLSADFKSYQHTF